MRPEILSLPAEHISKEGIRIPLCSRVARQNLGILLGIPPSDLQNYAIYRSLQFAPMGSAIDVHRAYKNGWRGSRMIGIYQYARTYGESFWDPPECAEYADLFFSTPSGHRCVAFKKDESWFILDPYYDNEDLLPSYFPFPFEIYGALLYSLKEAFLEGAAFYRRPCT